MRQPQTLLRKPQYESFVIDNLPQDSSVTGLAAASSLFEGDLSYWSGSGVAPLNGGGIGVDAAFMTKIASFLGVSETTSPLNGYWTVPSQNGWPPGPRMADSCKIRTRGVHDLYTTPGDVYNIFDPVTVGADSQTIRSLSGVATSPTLVTATTGGTFLAGPHNVVFLYRAASGVEWQSPAQVVNLTTDTSEIKYTLAALPTNATSARVFIDGEDYGAVTTGSQQTVTTPAASGDQLTSASDISVGFILPREGQVNNTQNPAGGPLSGFPVTGKAGLFIRVSIRPKFPVGGAI